MPDLMLLSGGAIQGLVAQVQAEFERTHGCTLKGTFGAVGLMQDRLRANEPCDVLILTDKLIRALASSGEVLAPSVQAVGKVATGVAVKAGEPRPAVQTSEALRAALLAATSIYVPDTQKSTAGIHVRGVLQQLGIEAQVADRLREFPNGATAMRELAQAPEAHALGCTQVSEILLAPGVDLVDRLPAEHALSTLYTAAIARQAGHPELARAFISELVRPEAAAQRRAVGVD